MMKHPDSGMFELDYYLAENDKVTIELQNADGSTISKLIDNQAVTLGQNTLKFITDKTGKLQLKLSTASKSDVLAVNLH